MFSLTKCFLLICVGYVTAIVDTSGTDIYATSNIISPEVKDVMNKLQKYLDDLEKKIVNFIKNLKENNIALESLEKYRATYTSSTNPECTTEPIEVYKSSEEIIDSIVNVCDNELPIDALAEFYSKIEEAKRKVKTIDIDLQKNSAICNNFPDLCEQVRKSLLEELDKILSSDEKAELTSSSNNVYMNVKENLESCFHEKSEGFCNELTEKTKRIADCNNKLS